MIHIGERRYGEGCRPFSNDLNNIAAFSHFLIATQRIDTRNARGALNLRHAFEAEIQVSGLRGSPGYAGAGLLGLGPLSPECAVIGQARSVK
jgi:hypothetical protein